MTVEAIRKNTEKLFECLSPDELAAVMFDLQLKVSGKVSAGKITEKKGREELGRIRQSVLDCTKQFRTNEFFQFREQRHNLIEKELMKWWITGNLWNYETIIGLVDLHIKRLDLEQDYLPDGLSDEQAKEIIKTLQPCRKMMISILQIYKNRRAEILDPELWDMLEIVMPESPDIEAIVNRW